jgi:peptide-methionine (R)-S-oxide reductase
MTAKISKPDSEWKKQLTPEQFQVTRKKGTERAFTGAYWDNHEKGVYTCICCGTELFKSDHKFESGTGWPSFWQPSVAENVASESDNSFFMRRRSTVQQMRRALGPRLRGRAATDGAALLHQLGFVEV